MKAGRKPVHSFNNLKIGKRVELEGKAALFPHQTIYQYNKRKDIVLIVINDNGKYYAKRIS